MIVQKNNKWLVMDSSGKKVLGTHYSKEEAKDQLVAIELSKKRRKEIEESQNLLNNSMTNLTEYYKKLCEDLKAQRMVLEAKIKEEKEKKQKKSKKADKDYDGDGKVESGSEEYLGSRSNAIKKAVAKREGKELKEYTTRMQDDEDTMLLRRKAAEQGGITDDMVNEPIPGSSTLPGIDLTQQTPEQIDKLNQSQSGTFGKPTGSSLKPKPEDNMGEKIIKRRKNSYGVARDEYIRQRRPSITDAANDLLNIFTGNKPGKVRDEFGNLVDRDNLVNRGNPVRLNDLVNRGSPIGLNDLVNRKPKSIFDDILNSKPSDLFFRKPKKDIPWMGIQPPPGYERETPILYSGLPQRSSLKRGLMGESTEYTIIQDTSMVESAAQKLGNNKKAIDHITHDNNSKVQLSENVIFGGFPQIKKD